MYAKGVTSVHPLPETRGPPSHPNQGEDEVGVLDLADPTPGLALTPPSWLPSSVAGLAGFAGTRTPSPPGTGGELAWGIRRRPASGPRISLHPFPSHSRRASGSGEPRPSARLGPFFPCRPGPSSRSWGWAGRVGTPPSSARARWAPRSAGGKELNKVPAAGVGDGSGGKVRAGAGVGGPERKNILCPPPDARGAGEERGAIGGGGARRGRPGAGGASASAPRPVLLLRGAPTPSLPWVFAAFFPRPHAFAGVTSYSRGPPAWSLARGMRELGRHGLGARGVHVRARAVPRRAPLLSLRGQLTRAELPQFTWSHGRTASHSVLTAHFRIVGGY